MCCRRKNGKGEKGASEVNIKILRVRKEVRRIVLGKDIHGYSLPSYSELHYPWKSPLSVDPSTIGSTGPPCCYYVAFLLIINTCPVYACEAELCQKL